MRVRRLPLVLVAIAAATSGCSDDGGTGSATGTREAFCTELRAVVEADLTIFDPLHPAGPDDTETATARLADAAPAEVADDMRLLADTFAEVTAVLDEVDPSDPAGAERIQALDIDDEEIAAAQAAVTGYSLAECRIDLAAINAASVPTSSTPSTTLPGTVPPTTLPPATVVTTTIPPATG